MNEYSVVASEAETVIGWATLAPVSGRCVYSGVAEVSVYVGAALATVVGVLIEVPVMLLVVSVVNRSKGWYEHSSRPFAVKS